MQPIVSVAPFLFLINIRSEALIEYVSQTDLKLPTFAVIQVSGEASGRIIIWGTERSVYESVG